MAETVKLESGDLQIFEVPIKVVMMSGTIKLMLDNLGMEAEVNDEVVPLPAIKGEILAKIIEWCTKHVDDDVQPQEDLHQEKRSDDIPEWDVDFLKVDKETLFAIVRAANFLDIKGLMEVSCKSIANLIKGKTPSEIRTLFNIMPKPETPDDDEDEDVAEEAGAVNEEGN